MANPEHLAILKQGVEAWNAWRQGNPDTKPDLSALNLSQTLLAGADLSYTNLSHLVAIGTDLHGASLVGSTLVKAELSGAELQAARMHRAHLGRATLFEANLEAADLGAADLGEADLRRAGLADANLSGATLVRADLSGADLAGACFIETVFGDTKLIDVEGLEECVFRGPCTVDFRTVLRNWPLPEAFLRECGFSEDLLELIPSLVARPLEFYSSFISYSHTDKPFARRLHDQLQARGIRCWLDEKDLKPGDRILDVVDGAIRLHDKLLICCSKASLGSWWVKDEIRKAQERERKEDRAIIIPLNLDGYLFEWEDGLASDLTSRLAADFTGWEQDSAKFEAEFERVVEALRA